MVEVLVNSQITPTGTPDTTLAGAITSGATSATMATCPGGVSTAAFRMRIDDEIIAVGAIGGTGNTVWSSLTRGAEGTTAAAHSNGASVFLVLTAAGLNSWVTSTTAWTTQTANTVWAGPTTGSAAAPTFRALVGADLSISLSQTIVSAAGATLNAINWAAPTITISGSTNITTAAGLNLVTIGIPTYSAASALTISHAATLSLLGAPAGGGAGPATITDSNTIWVQSGQSRFDGGVYCSAYGAVAHAVDSNTPWLVQSTSGSIGIAILGYANGGSEPARLVFRQSDNSTVHGYIDANTLQLNIHGTNGVVYYADSQNHTFVNGGITLTITPTTITAAIPVITLASATGAAGLRLPHGAAPTSPVNGDVWTTSAGGMFVRINGVTKTVTLT